VLQDKEGARGLSDDSGVLLAPTADGAGHRDPSTTKLYNRYGYNPDKAVWFFAAY
jgi:hypothetical protein